MAVTLKDIAKDLGVSVVTVSKALRNKGSMSAETRARVMRRAQELNYQPNWLARSLVTRRTNLIGLVVPSLGHPFFGDVARALARRIKSEGYHLVIAFCDEDPTVEEQEIELLLARQVDGLVVASCMTADRGAFFEAIEARKVPLVLVDRYFPGLDANYVGSNDEEIGILATEHLIECGCRRIAHIKGPETSTGIERLQGYRKALAAHGLEFLDNYVVVGKSGDAQPQDSGYEAMAKLMSMRPLPDGVFCYNDATATGVMKAITDAGLRIPCDIAVVGAGNMRYFDLLAVPLTTIDQKSEVIGERAGELVLRLLRTRRSGHKKTVIIKPTLVVRSSSARTGRRASDGVNALNLTSVAQL